ncbi:hypothetical protein ACHWQZ_G018610 [Mnemiopsis leidyi]
MSDSTNEQLHACKLAVGNTRGLAPADHSDNETSVVHGSNIFTVSIGDTCDVTFKKKDGSNEEVVKSIKGKSMAPPLADATIENKLTTLRRDLLTITKSASVSSNLTPQQRSALKDLRKNNELHVSIANKTAEFVVMPKQDMTQTTTAHFANGTVYKRLTMPQGENEAQKFIRKLTNTLETEVNSTIKRIAPQRNIPQDATDLLMSHHTNLPTARVMLKTHKYSIEEIRNLNPDSMKTRPIVSGCNSPFHKALWFVCHILSPLMNQVPTHLKNTHDFLESMRSLSTNDLKNLKFFTADVEALYTNINVHTAIEDVLEFAKENKSSINTYGLHLSDIQVLLETTLGKSYFVYNNQVYLQLLGLFMGTNPAPILATVKMWKLERASVYVDHATNIQQIL